MFLFANRKKIKFSQKGPRSLLILRFSSIGDILLTTPAIEALARHWPETKIFVAGKKSMILLLENNPYITELIPLKAGEGLLHFMRRLKKRKAEAILDLHNKARSKIIALFFFRTPRVIWKHRRLRDRLPLPLFLKNYHAPFPIAERYLQAAERLVGRPLEKGFLRYFPTEKEKREGSALMKARGIDLETPLIGVAMSAAWKAKAWPPSYFRELIALALAQEQELQFAFLGSPIDKALAQKIQGELGDPDRVFDLCGQPLRMSAVLISYCRVFLANDSGPMHIARAQGVPTLAIFGPTDPNICDLEGHILAYSKQRCSPCTFIGRKKCPRKHFRCMRELKALEIWEGLKKLLQKERVPYLHA